MLPDARLRFGEESPAKRGPSMSSASPACSSTILRNLVAFCVDISLFYKYPAYIMETSFTFSSAFGDRGYVNVACTQGSLSVTVFTVTSMH